MSTNAPITALVALVADTELLEVAETYACLMDELAAMVENSSAARTVAGRVVLDRLGCLHVELDELDAATPRTEVVRLANEVGALTWFVADQAHPVFDAIVHPLREARGALVDQVALRDWTVPA